MYSVEIMPSSQMPMPAVDPTVCLMDASPLIHLAMIGVLDLPLRFGPVIIPDAVAIETTYDRSKPYALENEAWMMANARAGGRNRWIERPATEIGELLKIAIETGRSRPRNVGEHAIVNWLADNIRGFGGPALVIYENGKIPNMLVREGLPDDVIVVTSRTFLALAQEAGHLDDAEAAWSIVAARDPRANPTMSYQLIKGSGA